VRLRHRSLRRWIAGLAIAGSACLALRALERPFRAAAPTLGGPAEGASSEFLRVRREQALIRAEGTALMLRALRSAPTLPEGGT
jgi:hypothetical protein